MAFASPRRRIRDARALIGVVAAVLVVLAFALAVAPRADAATVPATYKGWGDVTPATTTATHATAWNWTGAAWTTTSRPRATRVYLWPFATGFTWTWTSSTGWLAMRTADLSPALTPTGVPGTWHLAFDDEFNGTTLDTANWANLDGWHMNNVTARASNVAVSGGNLALTLASSTSGAYISSGHGDGAKVGFDLPVGGYAEARVYFPGNGTSIYNWPAWWASGPSWPAAGENDIAEGLGTLTVNYHSLTGAHNQGTVSGTWANAFHTYGLYRGATRSDVYWDGVLVRSYPTSDNGQGQRLLLNIGEGNTHVYGAGSRMLVDYVRAWT